MKLDLEQPLAPGEHREYLVKEYGDHPNERYKLIDANSERVIMDDVTYEKLAEHLIARERADGEEPRLVHEGELMSFTHYRYSRLPEE